MILHFSHMGLTDGRTFMFPFWWLPAPRLWLPLRPPLPRRGKCVQPEAHRLERDG
jgi:hypothetical protein